MTTPEIEEFAKMLVMHVRDNAIRSCDLCIRVDSANPIAERWRSQFQDAVSRKNLEAVISDCIDLTVSSLLSAIDQGLLPLSFRASSGRMIDLENEGFGELSGWFMGSGGWRSLYSKERFFDDFSDMTGP